jgi:glycosyltransferase involved in cell wall biosynthesis
MAPVQRPVVLFVLPWSLRFIGGVNQVVTNLAQQMRDAGRFEPLVLMADWDAAEPVFEEIHGLRTVRWQVRAQEPGMGMKARLAYVLWERRFRSRFARFCKEQGVQAVNIHYPGAMAWTFERALQAAGSHIPLLLSFHGTDVSNLAVLDTSRKDDWRRLLARCGAVVTCSQELGKRIEAALETPVRYEVIYNGVDAGAFIKTLAPEPEPGVILHVGKFDRNKGQDVLIDAFARIADEFPETRLRLVGGAGSELDALRTQARRLDLEERIAFFTDIPYADMPSHFAAASTFAFPSRQEAFGLVLLEAGACKLPVVASRVGGIPELIHDRSTGLLVEPGDAAALAQALRTLLSDSALARELGLRLSQRVAADFSWANTRGRYEALIGAIGGPGAALPSAS